MWPLLSACVGIVVLATAGCAPVYFFRAGPDAANLDERAEQVLQENGFVQIWMGNPYYDSQAYGCRNATDVSFFERQWDTSGGWLGPHYERILVELFNCKGSRWLLILPARRWLREAAELRDQLRAAFAPEIESGLLRVTTGYRAAFE